MKYFKYLDLEYKNVADKLLAYIYDNADTILYSHNYAWKEVDTADVLNKVPELIEMFTPLSLNIKYLAFSITKVSHGSIHIDNDKFSKCRINIPLLNCDKSETKFFTVDESPTLVVQPSGITLLKVNPDRCVHVNQYYLTQPVVFRNSEPHQVVSYNENQPRIICTIGFHEDIEYLLTDL
jgi:hypothetical protein